MTTGGVRPARRISADFALAIGFAAAATLVGYVAVRYPGAGPLTVGFAAIALLLATGAAATIARRRSTDALRSALDLGSRVGVALGAIWVLEIGFNNVVPPAVSTAAARGVVDNSLWAIITAITVAFGYVVSRRSGRARDGLLAGAWVGLTSGLIACLAGLCLVAFGMPLLLRDPIAVAEYAARGAAGAAPDFASYVARETLAGSLGHLYLIGIVFGAAEGLLGGAIAKLLIRSAASRSAEGQPRR